MKEGLALSGKKREVLGKKASKALRKEGFIPATSMVRRKTLRASPLLAFAAPFNELRKLIYTPTSMLLRSISTALITPLS
jgi:large subunit ribosomal protein L25